MSDFLKFIPDAANSPYAYGAYVIAAVLFVLVGGRIKTIRDVLKQIKHVPSSDRKALIESVTNSVIPATITAEQWIRNNRNRALFQLLAVVILLVASIVTIDILQPHVKPPPPESEAANEAHAFLGVMDTGSYVTAYAQMSADFKQNFPLDGWVTASNTYRRPLGSASQRRQAYSGAGEQPINGREINVHWYTYYTKFANRDKLILELVTLASPGRPEPWRVIGYQIDVDPNSLPK